jgi:hypothetical protein
MKRPELAAVGGARFVSSLLKPGAEAARTGMQPG